MFCQFFVAISCNSQLSSGHQHLLLVVWWKIIWYNFFRQIFFASFLWLFFVFFLFELSETWTQQWLAAPVASCLVKTLQLSRGSWTQTKSRFAMISDPWSDRLYALLVQGDQHTPSFLLRGPKTWAQTRQIEICYSWPGRLQCPSDTKLDWWINSQHH